MLSRTLIKVVFVHLLLVGLNTSAQTDQIDSLKIVLDSSTTDEIRMSLLQMLAQKSAFTNLDTSDKYAGDLLKLARDTEHRRYTCKALHVLADLQRRRSNYDSALFLAKQAEVLVEDSLQMVKILNAIGNIYFGSDKYDDAEIYYDRTIKIARAIGSAQDLYMNYNNLGMVYARKGSYTEAIKVNFAALHVIDSLELDVKTGSIFGVIGVIYQNMEQYENSYLYYRKAILADSLSGDDMGVITWEINWAIALQNEDKYLESKEVYLSSLIKARKKEYTRLEANVMCNLGSLLKEFDQPDSAAHYFKMGYDLADSVNATNLVGFSLRSLGQIYLESGDAEKAKPYIVESRKLAYQIDDVAAIRDAHGTISDYYELINQTDSAYHHYKLYTFYKDSILGESKLLEIGKMEAQHDYDKQKIIDDKEAEKKLELEKQKQEQQKIVIAVSLSAGAFVLILLIIIYRRLKITRTQKVLIEEQKEEVESQRDQIEDQNNLLETRHVEIQESISYAKRIQEAILPQDSLIEKWFKESFVIYKPKDVVAGDFYWFEEKGDTLYFAAADCTGHGVPGAMVSVVCHSALNRSVRECGAEKPSEILFKTRELVVKTFEKSKEQVKDGMDICLCSLNKKTKEFQFAGANNPLYILRNNEIEVIKGDNQPIGYDDDFNEFKNNVVDLSGADMIFLFTDGFPDQFGGNKGKKMGYKNFRNQLVENSLEPLDKQKTNLLNSFDQWKGEEEQVDDVCIIAVKLN